MNIIEIRIEGERSPKCIRPTVRLKNNNTVMLAFDTVDSMNTMFEKYALREKASIPDLTILTSLIKILPDISDNIIIRDDMVDVHTVGEPKKFRARITPVCNPVETAPDCDCIEAVCKIAHTPEVKQAYIDAQPPVQKTVKVTKPFSRIEMVDGVPVLKTGEEEVDELVFEEIPVVDESGNPVMDESGNQITHQVPVME